VNKIDCEEVSDLIRDHDLNNMIFELKERKYLRKIEFTKSATIEILSYLEELQKVRDLENFADYLIENASEAFEHQNRELLIATLKRWSDIK
jgi:hypothetical protein